MFCPSGAGPSHRLGAVCTRVAGKKVAQREAGVMLWWLSPPPLTHLLLRVAAFDVRAELTEVIFTGLQVQDRFKER